MGPITGEVARVICALLITVQLASSSFLHSKLPQDDILSEQFLEHQRLLRSKEERVDFGTTQRAIAQMLAELDGIHRETMHWNEASHDTLVFLQQLVDICQLERSNCDRVMDRIRIIDARFEDQERNLDNYLKVCAQRQRHFCGPMANPLSRLTSRLLLECFGRFC